MKILRQHDASKLGDHKAIAVQVACLEPSSRRGGSATEYRQMLSSTDIDL